MRIQISATYIWPDLRVDASEKYLLLDWVIFGAIIIFFFFCFVSIWMKANWTALNRCRLIHLTAFVHELIHIFCFIFNRAVHEPDMIYRLLVFGFSRKWNIAYSNILNKMLRNGKSKSETFQVVTHSKKIVVFYFKVCNSLPMKSYSSVPDVKCIMF